MRVDSVEFVMGAVSVGGAPTDALPEIAFAGRSNVGKSSLINRLIQRKSLARTSSTPGKTQQLNYYRVNDKMYFVDLPGYGFVHGGQGLRKSLGDLTDSYLKSRQQLRAVVQLIDARHGPSPLDLQLTESLRASSQPFLLIFTKVDKLTRGKLNQQMKRLEDEGHLADLPYLTFSAESGQGRGDLWQWILETISGSETTSNSGESLPPKGDTPSQ
ncbi:MAG: YihA family ribosome biogenesis GTP-binding protein [Gemmatimonadetes bacterium]|jgi:GTP-binding protein|nr:YihA family ribosome biogenesis GTP-binding protein [Gemmatimonadota bacterium]MBT6148001.1 YihA family ribosome biogenesis GTP-binding protein [Gemmatimonadota bacterium]MBT7863806.1 YihA family ribosome biogenesis GTP-binding protein [Gemmatimonadota bacterium]